MTKPRTIDLKPNSRGVWEKPQAPKPEAPLAPKTAIPALKALMEVSYWTFCIGMCLATVLIAGPLVGVCLIIGWYGIMGGFK